MTDLPHTQLAALVAALEAMASWTHITDDILGFLQREFPPGLTEDTKNQLIQLDQLQMVRCAALAARNALYGYRDSRSDAILKDEEIVACFQRYTNNVPNSPQAFRALMDANLASAFHLFAPGLTEAHRELAQSVAWRALRQVDNHTRRDDAAAEAPAET